MAERGIDVSYETIRRWTDQVQTSDCTVDEEDEVLEARECLRGLESNQTSFALFAEGRLKRGKIGRSTLAPR